MSDNKRRTHDSVSDDLETKFAQGALAGLSDDEVRRKGKQFAGAVIMERVKGSSLDVNLRALVAKVCDPDKTLDLSKISPVDPDSRD
jgi:hypothetical protein